MHNLDLVKVNHCLVQSIQMLAAVRLLVGPNSEIKNEILDMNRELRAAAAECQRVIKFMEERKSKLLLVQDTYVP